jgi:hypothetical protein
MGKAKQLSSDEQQERAEARRLANGIQDGAPSGFSGNCNKCGRPGHRAADCPGPGAAPGGAAAGGVAGDAAKIGKGHKQRGAGSVIVSKGPVETKSGVLKKDWQRMPTQLLNEWTQREKRPKPQYQRARPTGGKGKGKGAAAAADEEEDDWRKYLEEPAAAEAPTEWRQRVVLHDAKHADRTMAFCPAETSPTEELAREHAALLALLQVR